MDREETPFNISPKVLEVLFIKNVLNNKSLSNEKIIKIFAGHIYSLTRRKIEKVEAYNRFLTKQKNSIVRKDNFKNKYQTKRELLLSLALLPAKDFYNSDAWLKFRYFILGKSNKKCALCGNSEKLQVDHVMPRSLYPERAFEPSNMQILCKDCNFGKGRGTSLAPKENRIILRKRKE